MVKFELNVEDYLKIINDTFQNENISDYNEKIKYKKGSIFGNIHFLIIISFMILIFFEISFILLIIPILLLNVFLIFEATYYINKWESKINEYNNRFDEIKKRFQDTKEINIVVDEKEIIMTLQNEEINSILFNIGNIDYKEYHNKNIGIYNKSGDFVFIPVSTLDTNDRGRFLRRFNMDFYDVKNTRKF